MIGDPSNSGTAINGGGRPRGAHTSRDGDGSLGDGGGDDGDDDDDEDVNPAALNVNAASTAEAAGTQKKRKKSKKKKKKAKKCQSSPPRVPLSDLYGSQRYPEGEIQQYTRVATAEAEKRYAAQTEKFDDAFLQNYRKAAEVHRQTRQW